MFVWYSDAFAARYPDMVRARRAKHSQEKECAMCGAMCAMRMMNTDAFDCPTTGEAKTK